MSALVSFIIPHKGREAMLIETLNSICTQSFRTGEIEVVIVSQNKTVSASLEALKERLKLKIIFNEDGNTISHSRNIGARKAEGKYLAFLDADVELASNWTETVYNILTRNQDIALVSAMQINSEGAPPLERIRTALSNAELDTNVAFLPGRNLFLAKETFNKVNGFPEHLMTCEDYYFTDSVSKHGGLYYTSKTHYVHIGEDKAFVPMFKKEIWRGQSNIASIQGRRIGIREWPSFIVPFVITLGVLLSVISALILPLIITFALGAMTILPLLAYVFRLKKLTGSEVNVLHCVWFYILYFPARTIGTLLGVRGAVSTSSHKN